jgi:hypothetical protein
MSSCDCANARGIDNGATSAAATPNDNIHNFIAPKRVVR